MSTKTKEAATSQKTNGKTSSNGKAAEEVKANIQKLGATVVAERLDKLEALNGLKSKSQAIKEAENKLNNFEAASHKGDFKVSLEAGNGASFETKNAAITAELVDVIRKGIEKLKEDTNKEILSFEF